MARLPVGVKTLKYQLIVTKAARNTIYSTVPPLLFYPDTQDVSAISTKMYITPQGSIHDELVPGRLLSIEVMRDRLVHEILGAKLDAGATKLRGQALELRVAQHLGYTTRPEELLAGGYPDIRNQALEVKVQDAATIDLGKYSPQFKTEAPGCSGLSTEDVRYLIALTDATTGIVKGIVLTPGVNLGRHFTYITGESYKCQRSIGMDFFDKYDGQAVFNP